MTAPIINSFRIFHSQIDRCVRSNEEEFILELQRLVTLSINNSFIQRCVYEITQEANVWATDYKKKNNEILLQIEHLKKLIVDYRPELEDEEEDVEFPLIDPTISYYNKLISGERKQNIPLDPDPYDDHSLNSDLFSILKQISDRLFPTHKKIPKEIKQSIYEIDHNLNWLNNERLNYVRLNPGVIWGQINNAVKEINPPPKPFGESYDLDEILFNVIHGIPFKKVLYGWRSNYSNIKPNEGEKARFVSWKKRMTKGLQLLENEIEIRLFTRISSEWALKKYAARTGIYRYKEIRRNINDISLCAKKEGKRLLIESFLVDDAASYLFDAGFSVLTERHLSANRLDIYEETLGVESSRDALLIEAKIYKSTSEGKNALKTGLSQIYTYASSIESSFHRTENFLLIFRLSGAKLILPRESVMMGEYSFRIVHIDLAPPEVSGSRSPKPVLINLDDIISQIKAKAQPSTGADAKKQRRTV